MWARLAGWVLVGLTTFAAEKGTLVPSENDGNALGRGGMVTAVQRGALAFPVPAQGGRGRPPHF